MAMGATRNLILGNYAFNPYSAGAKTYGVKSSPNIGPVDKSGYAERDRLIKAKQAAIAQALKNKSSGAFASTANLKLGN